MKQHIVISAVGSDRVGMVHELSKAIADCGGSISESRMTSLGNEFAMLLLVNGNWHTLAKLEGEFKKLGDATGMNIQLRRTEERSARNDMLPYSIDVVCLDRAEGNFPIRTVTLNVGGRRPLGLGAGGAALLATFPDDEIKQVIEHHDRLAESYNGVTSEMLWGAVATARRERCGRNQEAMTPGIRGIGVAIPGRNGPSFAAISIGSIAERMTKQRSLELRELLLREASGLTDLISAGPSRTPDQ